MGYVSGFGWMDQWSVPSETGIDSQPLYGGTVPETIAGISIPDTKLVAEATSLVREAADDTLFNRKDVVDIIMGNAWPE